MSKISAIDLSGFSFTGKSAVYDLVSEFDSVKTFGKEVEFDLIRCPGGLRDLYAALVNDWSPVRSSESISAFLRLVGNTKGDGSLFSRLFDTGQMYATFFPDFEKISGHFVEQLSLGNYRAYWPFGLNSRNAYEIFFTKLSRKLRLRSDNEKIYLCRLSDEKFFHLVSDYLYALLLNSVNKQQTHVVLNNSIEPYNSTLIDDFHFPFKQIVVERDPRDVYLAASTAANQAVATPVLGKDINDFIKRYKLQRENNRTSQHSSKVIWFEDLVMDYAKVVSEIMHFLGLSAENHVAKKQYFDPKVSRAGVGAWKHTSDPNIAVIEKALSCYLYAE